MICSINEQNRWVHIKGRSNFTGRTWLYSRWPRKYGDLFAVRLAGGRQLVVVGSVQVLHDMMGSSDARVRNALTGRPDYGTGAVRGVSALLSCTRFSLFTRTQTLSGSTAPPFQQYDQWFWKKVYRVQIGGWWLWNWRVWTICTDMNDMNGGGGFKGQE